MWRKNCFAVLSTPSCTSTLWLDFFPDIAFIHSFLIPYCSLARSRYGIKNSGLRLTELKVCPQYVGEILIIPDLLSFVQFYSRIIDKPLFS